MVRKRLFEQVRRLRDAYPQPLVILEGDLAEISTFRSPQAILGALLVLETTERVPVLTTADKDQTALLLSILWKRQDKEAVAYGLRHKPKAMSLEQRQRFVVEGLPSIGETLARSLLQRFGSVRAVSSWSAVTIRARGTARDKNRPRTTNRPRRGRAVGAPGVGPNTREGPRFCHLARCPRTWRELVRPCWSAVSSRLHRRRRCGSLCRSLGGRTRRLARKSAPSSTSSRETPQSTRPPRPSRLDDPSGGPGCPAQFPGTRPT